MKLPDIASTRQPSHTIGIDRVGMSGVEIPIRLEDSSPSLITSRMNLGVNLDSNTKGIHMSRLYLLALDTFKKQTIDKIDFQRLIDKMIASQSGISNAAYLEISFELPIVQNSLLSGLEGYRYYPVSFNYHQIKSEAGEKSLKLIHEIIITLTYSSTCPCSASLARDFMKNNFQEKFSDDQPLDYNQVLEWLENESNYATPHAQRSKAEIAIKVDNPLTDPIKELTGFIRSLESAIQTGVQAVVKRQDEQEFARLNAQQLIFCEDAVRIIKNHMELDEFTQQLKIADYRIAVNHQESLHPHDAVAVAVKGLPGGYHAKPLISHKF